MKWRKLGLVYAPKGDLWWAKSYATIPTVDVLNEDVLRIYFASLDENRYGRIGYVDVDARNPTRVLYESPAPVLDLGAPGSFDDSGVNPSCVVKQGGEKYLYYIGWQRCERVPYMLFAGLAVDKGNERFVKYSRTPVLDRTAAEPFTRSATSIIREDGIFKNWYVSAFDWVTVDSVVYPTYVIRYATSTNGFDWESSGDVCINFEDENEFGFGRPWVIRETDKYAMWYSIRSRTEPYRIGYAESDDGINWIRKDDEAGIERSESGWDSEMICYPCVVDANGKRFMFYNGNRHGSTGFGCAILEN